MILRGCPITIREESNPWLGWVLEGLIVALLAFMPLAFGAVHAWSEQIVIVLAAAISVLFGIQLIASPATRFPWRWAYLPVAVFLLVAALQLVPLPVSVVRALSPHTAQLKVELLRDLPDSEDLLSSMTLSFYPRATRHNLRLVLAVAAVFVFVASFYRDPARIKRLLAAVAVIGGAVALLALAQDLGGNGKIYWSVPCYDRAHSGPFINHSHYSQFMNLSIGAALALLLVRVHEAFAGHTITPAFLAEYFRSPEARTVKLLLAMVVLGIVSVFLSLSRGGMVSLLIAVGFTTLMLSWRRSMRGRGWVIVLLALGAFVCLLWVGFDMVYDRMATLDEADEYADRWQIVRDIALAWTKFPVFGAGLGTHEVVYPMFDRGYSSALAMHAENEYAQTMEETGIVGLLVLAAFAVAVWISYARSVRGGSRPIHSAAYGLGFGLLAIQIHSLSDFGQHLPANAMLSAVSAGLLIALASLKGEVSSVKCHVKGPALPLQTSNFKLRTSSCLPVARRAAAPIAVFALFAWAILGAHQARTAASHWSKVVTAVHHMEADQWNMSDAAYKYFFSHAAAAVEAEPDNMHYQHWLAAYKWLSLAAYMDPNTGQPQAQALPWARQIVEELHAARSLCPTFGATYCLAGEIEKFVLADPAGAGHIHTGYQLAPCHPTACFAAARCDVEEGKAEEAFEKLARAVKLDGSLFPRAVQMCAVNLNRADLALKLAGDDPGRLGHVGNILADSGRVVSQALVAGDAGDANGLGDLAGQAKAMAFEQLRRRCEEFDAPASAHASLANLYHRQGDVEAAIAQYRRALMKNYREIGWHHALVQLLAGAGRVEDAIREAKICLQLRPDDAAAKKLIEQLSALPKTVPTAQSSGD